jgi:hypothetical protein
MKTVSFRSLTTTWAARLVAAFDASGVHRVGTPGDLASGTFVLPIAVVTPRTGWWESTAERAGGMVAWLAALHAAG